MAAFSLLGYRFNPRPLLVAVALLGTGFITHAAEAAAPRPNIVLIMADDMGYSDLGCYGSEIATPNIDRLAGDGLQMTQFYTTPRCCPTRAALLTGVYSHQAGIGGMMEDHGVPGYRGELSRNTLTIAEELKRADYRTSMIGKWHVSHMNFNGKGQVNFESKEPFWENKEGWPLQRGFDEYYGTIHGVNSYYDPFTLVQGNALIRPGSSNYYYTDAIADHAAESITRQATDSKPFFLYVAFTAPHWPLHAPEEDIAPYRETYRAGWDAIRTNRYQRQLKLGIIDKSWPLSARDERVPAWETVQDKAWEANRMATHAAMITRMDRGIGRILAALKAGGAEQNTLVMFLSDNGACDEVLQPQWYDIPSRTRDGRTVKVGNHDHSVMAGPEDVWQSYGVPWANVGSTPFRLYKHFAHEGGISTPFIARWPKVIKPGGGPNRQTGHIIDIMATCVELAGAHHPRTFEGRPILPLEGSSLLPLFQGVERPDPTPLFWEHEGHRAVRLDRWKLVSRHGGEWELYDIVADRTEQNNLAARHPDSVRQLAALYEEWAKRCNVLRPGQLPPARKIVPASLDSQESPVERSTGE